MTDSGILAMFRVDGRARTKGSLNTYCLRNRSHTVKHTEQTKDSSRWRKYVAIEAQRHMLAMWGELLNYQEAIEIRLLVHLPRTIGVSGEVWESHDTDFPTAIDLGDTDKLQRNIGDALVDARMIKDDSLITTWLAAKRWVPDGDTSRGWVEILVIKDPNCGRPEWMPHVG